jgi:hypothetical protein
MTPTIHTYLSADAPEAVRAVALITTPGRDAKGNPKADLHPVIFRAIDEATARKDAETWWAAELAKAEAKRLHAKRLGEARSQKAERGAAA